MYEIVIHGRGGQGVVTLSRLLAQALYHEGKTVQAFPTFGAERTGAPVAAFVRVAETAGPILIHHPVSQPQLVIVQDSTLLANLSWSNLPAETHVLINSSRSLSELGLPADLAPRTWILDANKLAREYLGAAIPNTVLLAAAGRQILSLSQEAVLAAVTEQFASKKNLLEQNITAVKAVWELAIS